MVAADKVVVLTFTPMMRISAKEKKITVVWWNSLERPIHKPIIKKSEAKGYCYQTELYVKNAFDWILVTAAYKTRALRRHITHHKNVWTIVLCKFVSNNTFIINRNSFLVVKKDTSYSNSSYVMSRLLCSNMLRQCCSSHQQDKNPIKPG